MNEGVASDEKVFSPGLLVTLGCIAVVAAIPMAAYFTRAATDRWLASGGFALSVSGIVLSVVGFGVTLWQLKRTASATQAVAGAIIKLRRDLSALDVLTELRSAAEAAEEAQVHLRDHKWSSALTSYNKVRRCLHKTIAVVDAIDTENQEIAKDFIAHAMGACSELENAEPDTQLDITSMNSKLRDLEGFLISLEYKTKDTFGGQ